MRRSCLVILLLLGGLPMLFAGPFGLEFGWTMDEMVAAGAQVLQDQGSAGGLSIYTIIPPSPHGSLNTYMVGIDSEYGLTSVAGAALLLDVSQSGVEIISLFDRLEAQLTGVYGYGTRYDFLVSGSIWNVPNDFMMALCLQERFLASFWQPDSVPSGGEEYGVAEISLEASAFDEHNGSVTLLYHGENADMAAERQNESDMSVL